MQNRIEMNRTTWDDVMNNYVRVLQELEKLKEENLELKIELEMYKGCTTNM